MFFGAKQCLQCVPVEDGDTKKSCVVVLKSNVSVLILLDEVKGFTLVYEKNTRYQIPNSNYAENLPHYGSIKYFLTLLNGGFY